MDNKKCKYCQSEIDKKAKICPICKKNQTSTGTKIVVAVLCFILFYAFILTITDTSPVSNNNVQNEQFSVIEHFTTSDDYWTYIVGTVKNNTNKNYSYAQIEINLYDSDGNLVNSTLDNINNLEANGTWKFKALATSEFSTYKIKEVTGW